MFSFVSVMFFENMRLKTRFSFFLLVAIFIFTISSSFVIGNNHLELSTISGYIYDFSFDLVHNTIVEINTSPRQLIVATDGSYSFNIAPGKYLLTARKDDLISEDEILIESLGNFRYDIILFPSFDDEEWLQDILSDIYADSGLDEFDFEIGKQTREYFLYFLLGAFAIIINFIIMFRKKIFLFLRKSGFSRKNDDVLKNNSSIHDAVKNNFNNDDSDRIISYLESEGGRSTQKEIRKHIALSEAKTSLLLAELENNGSIKRFKRGRSNVVVLQMK